MDQSCHITALTYLHYGHYLLPYSHYLCGSNYSLSSPYNPQWANLLDQKVQIEDILTRSILELEQDFSRKWSALKDFRLSCQLLPPQKIFWSKKNFKSKKDFWSKKKFCLKKSLEVKKDCGPKFCFA